MAGLSSFLAAVVGVVLWLVLDDDPYVAPPPATGAAAIRSAEAGGVLQELARAVEDGDPEAAAALAGDSDAATASRLGALVENAAAIPLTEVSFRYVDELEDAGASGEWQATVATSWRVAGVAEPPIAVDVRFDFGVDGDRVVVAGVGGAGGTTPVWLSGPLDVRRDDDVVVLAASGADRYARLARRAVVVVRRVLPRWDGALVVEVPARAGGVDAALDVGRGTFANVAGVAAAADGSAARGAPVHVFLNPQQMRSLRPQGQQVVVSHEATHVAVAAPGAEMPVWLLEGFADYVALRDVDLPLSTTAAQAIRQVRRQGVPRRLPDEQDFDQESSYFGAAYEASWLACRLLADQVGEDALVRLYRRADGAADFEAELERTTGSGFASFTRAWRRLLGDLAA